MLNCIAVEIVAADFTTMDDLDKTMCYSDSDSEPFFIYEESSDEDANGQN